MEAEVTSDPDRPQLRVRSLPLRLQALIVICLVLGVGAVTWVAKSHTDGKGAESEWPLFRNFGELELRDIEDGIRWLEQKPYVDTSRIGMHGWSFGDLGKAFRDMGKGFGKIGDADTPRRTDLAQDDLVQPMALAHKVQQ